MNAKHTFVILAVASSLGMSIAWSAPAQDNDEDSDGHHHNSQTEQTSTDEHHHGHGPRDMEHGHMGHRPMHPGVGAMSEERHHMMEEHRKMMSKLESEQADLDKKLERMNSSTGQEKIEAMSAVINQIANERKEMLAHMKTMHRRMMAHMDHMRSMMPNPEHEPAGAPNQPHEEDENK